MTKEAYTGSIKDLPQYDIQRIRVVSEANKDIALSQFISSNMKFIFSRDGSAVISSKKATKENALRKFAQYFNVDIWDTIAFGDDTNDMDMLKIASIGIAMGNSIDEVKSAADFVWMLMIMMV